MDFPDFYYKKYENHNMILVPLEDSKDNTIFYMIPPNDIDDFSFTLSKVDVDKWKVERYREMDNSKYTTSYYKRDNNKWNKVA